MAEVQAEFVRGMEESRNGRRTRVRRPGRGWGVGLLFVLPAVALFAVFGVYTVVFGFSLSFARWDGFSPNWTWTGLDNYIDLLGGNPAVSPDVVQAATNTAVGMVALPLLVATIGFLLAVLLHSV